MKSLLYSGDSHFELPPGCALGERIEIPITFRKDGRLYRIVMRDKITTEDLLIIQIKAMAFAIREREPMMAQPIRRSVKDFLIKRATVI